LADFNYFGLYRDSHFERLSVRFLICGGRGRLLDRNYAIMAQKVGTGEIKTAQALATAMQDIVPTDNTATGPNWSGDNQTRRTKCYCRAGPSFRFSGIEGSVSH
jgi:hypothetical protein